MEGDMTLNERIDNLLMEGTKYWEQRAAYAKAVSDLLPPGAPVNWMTRGHRQAGCVISTSFDRVQVRNSNTCRIVWIHVDAILKARTQGSQPTVGQ